MLDQDLPCTRISKICKLKHKLSVESRIPVIERPEKNVHVLTVGLTCTSSMWYRKGARLISRRHLISNFDKNYGVLCCILTPFEEIRKPEVYRCSIWLQTIPCTATWKSVQCSVELMKRACIHKMLAWTVHKRYLKYAASGRCKSGIERLVVLSGMW